MVFSSHIFLFYFLPLALLAYYATPRGGKALVLTLASYVFYGWWNPWFTLLMLASTAVDYACGKAICAAGASPGQRKAGMITSVAVNLSILGFYKYAGFFAGNASTLAEMLGWGAVQAPAFIYQIVLPVGISFYTFQSMSYSIDLYRGHARPAPSFLDFACYVSLFPQLVAGPIVRYGSVAEQLHHRVHTSQGFALGIARFSLGFAKKILLANPMGAAADSCFAAGDGVLTAPLAWLGACAYAFQIYFDFSAYSDMAIGLGRMLGFRFPENFDSPYKSASITEFWRRWHISLSSFLRDYLYIPLGGNRKGTARTYANLMIVMLLGGLWHGAQWNYLAWGAIHGTMLAAERMMGKSAFYGRLPHALKVAATFGILLITWVYFRAENMDAASRYILAMFGQGGGAPESAILAAQVLRPANLFYFVLCGGIAFFAPRSVAMMENLTGRRAAMLVGGLAVAVAVMFTQGFNPFLYFQF
ncbi:MAG: MBOAT family protein [Verrucomicrobiales bacterium]